MNRPNNSQNMTVRLAHILKKSQKREIYKSIFGKWNADFDKTFGTPLKGLLVRPF